MAWKGVRILGNWLRRHPGLARWALLLLPDVTWQINIAEIGKLKIRTRRNRSYWLRDPLSQERFPLEALRALVRPGATVYDVGANIGLYSRFLVNCFGAARVIAFEPMRDNVAQLISNLELGGIKDQVTILPIALCDSDEQQELQLDDFSSASAALSSVTGGEASQGRKQYGLLPKTEAVTCRRLDTVIEELNLPPPDVIKVDIEGAEGMFLLGAMKVLRQHSPKLLIELHGASHAKAVYRTLRDLGYHCAGSVSRRLAPAGYGILNDAIVDQASDQYDIHFLIAAKNPGDVPAVIRSPQ
jgi:FkbM family methyltransferase